jgi:hypothetical protein
MTTKETETLLDNAVEEITAIGVLCGYAVRAIEEGNLTEAADHMEEAMDFQSPLTDLHEIVAHARDQETEEEEN